MGTSNKEITKMLLSQIERKPQNDKLTEREGYALASGIALGFVNLASPSKDSELDLDERLLRFIEGGK
jgi:anaphase-promoting complex subunit 1